MATTVSALPPPPTQQPIADAKGNTNYTWQDWLFRLRQAVITASVLPSGFAANQLLGVNNAGNAYEWKSVTAGSTKITITHSAGGIAVDASVAAISPLTTKGDVWGFGPANARVPVGADGLVLTADSAQALGVKWAASAAAAQAALQFQDEGGNLGAAGTVDTVNFVGQNIAAVRATNKVTLTDTPWQLIQYIATVADVVTIPANYVLGLMDGFFDNAGLIDNDGYLATD